MKMDFNSIGRQTAWMRGIQFKIESVGEPQETQYGFCQAITATDERGLTECMNYFFDTMEVSVDPSEVGDQFYDVKWDKKQCLYKCIPATPPIKDELVLDRPDWNDINRRHFRKDILCAVVGGNEWNDTLERMNDIISTPAIRTTVNILAEFAMTGKISEK